MKESKHFGGERLRSSEKHHKRRRVNVSDHSQNSGTYKRGTKCQLLRNRPWLLDSGPTAPGGQAGTGTLGIAQGNRGL